MKKNTFKILSIILLSTFFVFTACNDDVLNENIQNVNAGIKSKKISFDEFKKQKKAFTIVFDINQKQNELKSLSNKTSNSIVNNFTIDTQKGLYLEYANLHSFTFPIHREVDNGKVENLLLSFQSDGSYKAKILKYNLTQQEKIDIANDQLKNIQNPIITIPIENFNLNSKVSSCEIVTETIWVSCSQGIHNSSNINTWAQCEAATPPRVYTVSKIKCITADGSTGGSPPIDDGFGDYNGIGGGSNYPPEYPTAQTDPANYEQGISAPMLTTQNNDDIRNTLLFNQSLTPQQTQWSEGNSDSYNQILNLVREQNWTDDGKAFGKELIDTSIKLEINAKNVWDDYNNFINQMANTEKVIFDNLLPNRKLWYMCAAKKAFDKANELFPPSINNNILNGKGDAYRHALWNGLATLLIGGDLTDQLTTAHESKLSKYPFNNKENEMDLYNNNKGRQTAIYSNLSNISLNILIEHQSGYLRYLSNLDSNSQATFYSILIPTNQ